VSFAAITLYIASQRVSIFVYFVIDSVWKLLDTPSYFNELRCLSRQFVLYHELLLRISMFNLALCCLEVRFFLTETKFSQ
jgi:hypothetical protein